MRHPHRRSGGDALAQVGVAVTNAAIVVGVIGPAAAGDPSIVAELVRSNPAPLVALELLKLAAAAHAARAGAEPRLVTVARRCCARLRGWGWSWAGA